MKKLLLVVSIALFITGCDSKPDAPFGLKWGQSMDSVSFIKDGDCEKEDGITTCKFDNQKPFNEWTFSNELKFDRDGLVEIGTVLAGTEGYSPSFHDFKEKLSNEAEFLLSKGFDQEILGQIKQKCEESAKCDKTSERARSSVGSVSIWVTTTSTQNPIEVTTYTK
ncbi:TPA: hypothetical protein U2M59_000729 [Providencia stuartii]|nr:hypothetical protein [Providencia stuartii]